LIAPLIVLRVLGALEIGHRLGGVKPITAQQVSTISAPILAMVGFLLAFSFSMAGDRLAARRGAAVQEANAIGTFWLRTSADARADGQGDARASAATSRSTSSTWRRGSTQRSWRVRRSRRRTYKTSSGR
jgi:hypothetical protein